jgi:O-antigen ligase
MQASHGAWRLFYAGIAVALFICLVFTESRIAYFAFAAGLVLFLILRLDLLRGQNRPLTIALTMAGIGVGLLIGYVAIGTILQSLQVAFIDLRPSSWLVRLNIYVVTLRLLPEHLIAGWGVPVRIPGASVEYSAGTHSSYLGLLFQHGVVGLLLYLALWVSVWKSVLSGLGQKRITRLERNFWIAMATAFFAFDIREIADSWWWDQSLTFVIWTMWGLALTASRVFRNPELSAQSS